MNEDTASFDRMRRLGWVAVLVGIIAIIAWMFGYMADPSDNHQQAMYGYLFGFVFWGSTTIGAFGMMLLQGSIKSSWGISIVRVMEAAGGPVMLALVLILFLPIALPNIGLDAIYKWTDMGFMQSDAILSKKLFYLTERGFWMRTLIIVGIWAVWSFLLKRSSLRQDKSLDKKEWGLRSNWGSPGLVMFFITVSVISTDWVMSLQPKYFSTIYGIIFAIGCGLSAMSLAVLIVLYNSNEAPFRQIVTPKLVRDYGNFLLTLTMLWAYTTLAQFLITWEGNLPLEVPYYIRRSGQTFFGGHGVDWNVLSNLVMIFQFFVPFFALIAPRTKRVVRNLIWLSVTIWITRIFTVYWLIFPDVRPLEGFGKSLGHWTDYAAFLGIGGIWFSVFVFQYLKVPFIPKYDTRLMEVEHA
ncbi:MAG TPA: hypothetical protein VGL56_16945 [Fimbriimonadaceae bacterium]|jgi:hypothetical protein